MAKTEQYFDMWVEKYFNLNNIKMSYKNYNAFKF